MRRGQLAAWATVIAICSFVQAADVSPDITVAADGSGQFKTVQEALDSIPRNNTQRMIIFIKDGVYKERVNINAPFITLQGQSRKATRIEFSTSDTGQGPGGSVLNVNGTDCVIQNLSVVNTFNQIGPHEMAVYGRTCDRCVITDCDLLSQGADTLSLWQGDVGRYYHARLYVTGAADFVCPRGWCYMADSTLYEVKDGSAGMWHDGSKNQDQKFVMRNCKFDGVEGAYLARHHHDAWIGFIDCTFTKAMSPKQPYRVIYPLNGGTPTDADKTRNADLDKTNIWGDRTYYHNSHKDGGDLPWMANNLDKAAGAPKPEQITAKWTFGGTWDPEDKTGPKIVDVRAKDGKLFLKFTEPVTLKGVPMVRLKNGSTAPCMGTAADEVIFNSTSNSEAASVDLNGGAIIATQASVNVRNADLALPK